jgi:hypothetical protein
MAGLGESLAMDQATLAIATYALALLEHEEAAAMDTPGRMAGSDPLTPDYLAGLLIAKRLWAALGDEGNDVPAE